MRHGFIRATMVTAAGTAAFALPAAAQEPPSAWGEVPAWEVEFELRQRTEGGNRLASGRVMAYSEADIRSFGALPENGAWPEPVSTEEHLREQRRLIELLKNLPEEVRKEIPPEMLEDPAIVAMLEEMREEMPELRGEAEELERELPEVEAEMRRHLVWIAPAGAVHLEIQEEWNRDRAKCQVYRGTRAFTGVADEVEIVVEIHPAEGRFHLSGGIESGAVEEKLYLHECNTRSGRVTDGVGFSIEGRLPGSGVVMSGSKGVSEGDAHTEITYTIRPITCVRIAEPRDHEQFAFEGSGTGRLEIPLRAIVLRGAPGCSGRIAWDADDVDGATRNFQPRSGAPQSGNVGEEVLLTYSGLPERNDQFGSKMIFAEVGNHRDSVSVEVFFRPDAKNHGGAGAQQTPNWFHYWSQTPAAGGHTPRYERVRMSRHAGEPVQAQYDYFDDMIIVTDRTFEKGCYARPNSPESTGIDCFAELVRHEAQHQKERWDWWGELNPQALPGTPHRAYDTDQDLVPNRIEEKLAATRGCKTWSPNSCSGRPEGHMFDVELNAYTVGWGWTVGGGNLHDWSWCGKQWKDVSVCSGGRRW